MIHIVRVVAKNDEEFAKALNEIKGQIISIQFVCDVWWRVIYEK